MKKELDDIVQLVSEIVARDVSIYDESFLAKSLEKRLAATSIDNATTYLRYISENWEEAQAFIDSLNINYSEFFRGLTAFAALEQLILPKLIDEKKRSGQAEIRIWSAGCSAGQEAYSIAILLDELSRSGEQAISFRIFATDTSKADLESAEKGTYNLAAVRNVRLKHIRQYFTQHGETWTIDARLRDRIDFSYYDLLDKNSSSPPASIYGDFDIVICSNLLFYYRQDVRELILDKICRSLCSEGYLVTGEAERGIVGQAEGFREVGLVATIFQKTGRRM